MKRRRIPGESVTKSLIKARVFSKNYSGEQTNRDSDLFNNLFWKLVECFCRILQFSFAFMRYVFAAIYYLFCRFN